MTAPTLAARRLVLTAAEFAHLARVSGVDPLPGFAADAALDESARRDATARLVERGVLDADAGTPVESVAANLAVLAEAVVTVRAEVSVHGSGLRAAFAVRGPLGASLFTLGDGAVELSMFPAVTMGRELRRATPGGDQLTSIDAQIRQALRGHDDEPLAGRLPLAALSDYDETRRIIVHGSADEAGGVRLTDAERSLAERVARRTTGTLWCLVTGRSRDGAVLVGQVVWLCTDDGWLGLRPEPDGTGRRTVALVPAAGDDLGGWLAPYIAAILEAASDRP